MNVAPPLYGSAIVRFGEQHENFVELAFAHCSSRLLVMVPLLSVE